MILPKFASKQVGAVCNFDQSPKCLQYIQIPIVTKRYQNGEFDPGRAPNLSQPKSRLEKEGETTHELLWSRSLFYITKQGNQRNDKVIVSGWLPPAYIVLQPDQVSHVSPSASHLLRNTAEVLVNVVHAAFLQHLTRMGLSKAVNPHTVHLIHLTLHEMTTGLSNSHHVQQIGSCQQGLDQMLLVFSTNAL